VNVSITGTTVHAKLETPNMYASIDGVVDRLSRKLMRYKERRLAGWHEGDKSVEEDTAEVISALEQLELLEEEETEAKSKEVEYQDPEAPVVTKIRSFDLKNSITMEEAIFALDYVDHDFYVYRDNKSGEVNVVYKRNAGGIGLIEPDQ